MSYNFTQYRLTLGTRDNWGSIQNNMVSALSQLDNELELARKGYPTLTEGLNNTYLTIQEGRELLDDPFPSIKLLYLLADSGVY